MMQNYLLDPEHLYAWPLSTVARLGMFIYVILSRYVGAVDEAEQANTRLRQRLAARETELADSHEQLRAVQQRQMLTRERQRLMQDIHDGMGSQLMSALRVAESGQLSEAQMVMVLRECIEDLKLTVDSLEPVEADLLLLATLRYRLTPCLQEGISHIIQHAGATELRVATGESAGGVFVMLDDNGKQGASKPGKGLPNMVRRAHAVGGEVSWERTESGTRFRLWLPLAAVPEHVG